MVRIGKVPKLVEKRGLYWQPTTRMGMQHGVKKLQNNANTLMQTSRLLKNPRVQEMLSKGIVPSELKSPTYRQLFSQSLKRGTGTKTGLTVGVPLGAFGAYNNVMSTSDAATVSLILTGVAAASAFGGTGVADAAGGKIKHRVSPEGRAEAKARTFKKLTPEQIQKASKFFAKQAIEANARANELRARLSNKLQTQ